MKDRQPVCYVANNSASLLHQLHQLSVAGHDIVFHVFWINLSINLCEELAGTFDFCFSISRSSMLDIEPLVSATK